MNPTIKTPFQDGTMAPASLHTISPTILDTSPGAGPSRLSGPTDTSASEEGPKPKWVYIFVAFNKADHAQEDDADDTQVKKAAFIESSSHVSIVE